MSSQATKTTKRNEIGIKQNKTNYDPHLSIFSDRKNLTQSRNILQPSIGYSSTSEAKNLSNFGSKNL
jgi:hypothetical protein